ncbi:MAG: 1-(5-phosphoribosyl)-5-[(5-phosphoribosylamino)methylideneamino]imidazole-4-carboxamide isomerase [Pirellulaceae bacterium]|nr:1-(5-phosphoribosyl)-5-[(5-phosphoribosylamino)methylideneamino]imidazole-4-carboxamide isomerase [Planctomycetales bacterium]
MELWPAIDIRGGKCVRLIQGDYSREKVYGEDPADMAARWVLDGATRLHLVDLDGARAGSTLNEDAIRKVVEKVGIPCELGGGVRDAETIASYLEMGVSRLVIGTKALTDPQWFREMCTAFPGKLVVGIDARGGNVATNGWLETSDTSAVELARAYAELPVAAIVYTDISRDGMLSGPNFEALEAMVNAVPLPIVASGGVTTVDDIQRVAQLGAAGCIVGRTIYEGKLSLVDAIKAAGANP